MIIVFSLLGIILMVIGWVLFVPVLIRLDTESQQLCLTQWGSLTAICRYTEKFPWDIRILGLKLPAGRSKQSKKRQPRQSSARKMRKSPAAILFLVRGIFRSLRIRQLFVNLGIDDVVLTAQLVPVLLYVNRGPVSIQTNAHGMWRLRMEVEARLNKLLWVIVRFLLKK